MNSAQIARQLWDRLWEDYSRRVDYARTYQAMIQAAGGTVANDHIAFRSLRLTAHSPEGPVNLGIPYLEGIVRVLGYTAAGEYEFPDQHLYARHYQHPEQDTYDLPKLFISELIVDQLPADTARMIEGTVQSGKSWNREVNRLLACDRSILSTGEGQGIEELMTQLQGIFTRPWEPPKQSVVEAVNAVSQYGAWVLLHGYAVNHFTGYVNRQNTAQYPDIESTVQGLKERGIPMKAEIEGSRGSGLRQTATQAVRELVTVQDDNTSEQVQIPWTYAYYEIAERNWIEVVPGQKSLFEGFLGPQARNLFEMTRRG